MSFPEPVLEAITYDEDGKKEFHYLCVRCSHKAIESPYRFKAIKEFHRDGNPWVCENCGAQM